jgi:hypothetical protein
MQGWIPKSWWNLFSRGPKNKRSLNKKYKEESEYESPYLAQEKGHDYLKILHPYMANLPLGTVIIYVSEKVRNVTQRNEKMTK